MRCTIIRALREVSRSTVPVFGARGLRGKLCCSAEKGRAGEQPPGRSTCPLWQSRAPFVRVEPNPRFTHPVTHWDPGAASLWHRVVNQEEADIEIPNLLNHQLELSNSWLEELSFGGTIRIR